MNSLFEPRRNNAPALITLPTSCAPTEEADDLVRKREAALRWMQENGVTYLGAPPDRIGAPRQPQPRVTSMRLVRQRRRHGGDEIAPDQAQNS